MESIPNTKTPILAADDDTAFLMSVKAILVSGGIPEPALVSDSRRVMDLIREHHFEVLLLDLIMPHIHGLDILKQVKEEFPSIECVVITASDDAHSAVQAMKYGAFDYLVKPIESEKLAIVIDRAMERYKLREERTLHSRAQSFADLLNPEAFETMVAADEAMARVFHQAEVAAPSEYNVLVTGESGTGKEMLAQTIHKLSYRSRENFVAVNMASFSNTLFEDEFFGHSKGAYTGAQSEKKGFMETAHHGTLYLDEISELDPELQGKLLRVIEEKELYRLGSTQKRVIDVRFIASSNRDLHEEMETGRFRKDLFYRLSMFHLHLPPLRERKKDIIPLASHFLKLSAEESQKNIDSISSDLAERLLRYSFPGNVRELKNIIAEAVLLEKGKTLTAPSARGLRDSFSPVTLPPDEILNLAEMERRHIARVLETTGGNRTKAAEMLGIGLRTLRRKLNAPE